MNKALRHYRYNPRHPFPPPSIFHYETDEGIPIDVYYDYDPPEPAVMHGPGICGPIGESIHVYKIMIGKSDLGVDALKALMGERWEPWLETLKDCIRDQENDDA